jgi:hypothetical protein
MKIFGEISVILRLCLRKGKNNNIAEKKYVRRTLVKDLMITSLILNQVYFKDIAILFTEERQ